MYWNQKSRADWLKEEDKNTKFFHANASSKRRKNRIEGIENSLGNWRDDTEEIERRFYDYFHDLFTTSNPGEDQINAVPQTMAPKVTTEMNATIHNRRDHDSPLSDVSNKSFSARWIASCFLSKALGSSQRWSPYNLSLCLKRARYYSSTQSYIYCSDSQDCQS